MRRKEDAEKLCENCGARFSRQRYVTMLEDRSAFLRKRFCSLTCANSRPGTVKKGTFHFRARKHMKQKCETCETSKSLQVHHVDQDHTNNTPSNLQTLCKHCHGFWHATQKRRGWTIAGQMPLLAWGGRQA